MQKECDGFRAIMVVLYRNALCNDPDYVCCIRSNF